MGSHLQKIRNVLAETKLQKIKIIFLKIRSSKIAEILKMTVKKTFKYIKSFFLREPKF